tara:strand:+ start:1874 stop:2401 length:528 start_codon:yes stop_codon:yes gene_type:complete
MSEINQEGLDAMLKSCDSMTKRRQLLMKKKRSNGEDLLQAACKTWFEKALPDLMWYAVWNENYYPDEKQAMIQGARKKRMGVRAGVCDYMFVLPNGMAAGIELKWGNGKPSDSQKGWAEAMVRKGCRHAFCWNGAEVEAALRSWGLKPLYPFPPINKGSAKLLRQSIAAEELWKR